MSRGVFHRKMKDTVQYVELARFQNWVNSDNFWVVVRVASFWLIYLTILLTVQFIGLQVEILFPTQLLEGWENKLLKLQYLVPTYFNKKQRKGAPSHKTTDWWLTCICTRRKPTCPAPAQLSRYTCILYDIYKFLYRYTSIFYVTGK
jgi:hypothetical protein